MQPAPDREKESASLQALLELDVLDSEPDAEFDALVRVASALCGMPIALISLIDADRQWFKANFGLTGTTETARDISFCGHTVLGDEIFEVSDARVDVRFADNPLVTGHPHIRHYAGAPVRLSDGLRVGTICVLAPVPGRLDEGQRQALQCLATVSACALEGRHGRRAIQAPAARGSTALERSRAVFQAGGPAAAGHDSQLCWAPASDAAPDLLTGLTNRAGFERLLQAAWEGTVEEGVEHALMFIDIDQFRVVNDACGHTAGDVVLRDVARLLIGAVRAADVVARIGGDEFAIILKHCSPEQAQAVAQTICDSAEAYRFMHGGQRFRIGTSIGLVPVDRRFAETESIIQAAEASCFAAAEAGGRRIHTWRAADAVLERRHGEMQWATRIEQALDEDRFVLFAQRIEPVARPQTGLHAEVLVRLVDTDGQLVMPGIFLPAAERYRLAARIDRWVLKRAIAWLAGLSSPALVDNLSVNLSGQSVGDPAFQAWALQTLAEAGFSICRTLCLEITETAAVSGMAVAAKFIAEVRALGARVALDDFGVGASSFGYLKNFQIDFLKIDGQFIRDLLTDPLNDAAVRCFTDVARVIGVKTVAEFVDDPAVLARIGEIGVDFAQGYLLHRPAPLETLLAAAAPGPSAARQPRPCPARAIAPEPTT